MRHQPVPTVDDHDVDRVVARDFPEALRAEARRRLQELGTDCGPRTRLAVLKLAGGDMQRLADHIEVAQRDWRDVIAAAEYPAAFRLPFSPAPGEEESAYAADWLQYQEWLHAKDPSR